MKIYFKTGWAAGLGYTMTNTELTYKDYPCMLKGTLIDADPNAWYSRCDLFIGTATSPYLQINNLQTLMFDVGKFLYIGIPRIKIANSPGTVAVAWFEVQEVQAGFWYPTVSVYKSADRNIFTIASASGLGNGALSFTPTTLQFNLITTYWFSFTQTTTAVDAVVIYWDTNLPISFDEVDCKKLALTTTCWKFGYPVYWVYVFGTGVKQSTVDILMPTTTSINIAWEKTLAFSIFSFGTASKTITRKVYLS